MRWRLPFTKKDAPITCYDDLNKPKTHGLEQRYVSPTTGVCRKLVVQAVTPSGKFEVAISSHTNQASKLAMWLLSNSPLRGWIIFEWIARWLWFTSKLLGSVAWLLAQLFAPFDLSDDAGEDTADSFNTGFYKPYVRGSRGQLWAARSPMEYSARAIEDGETDIPTHTLYPRLLIIHDPHSHSGIHDSDKLDSNGNLLAFPFQPPNHSASAKVSSADIYRSSYFAKSISSPRVRTT